LTACGWVPLAARAGTIHSEKLLLGRSLLQFNPLCHNLTALGKITLHPDPQTYAQVFAAGGAAIVTLELRLLIVAHVENDVFFSVQGEFIVVKRINLAFHGKVHGLAGAQNLRDPRLRAGIPSTACQKYHHRYAKEESARTKHGFLLACKYTATKTPVLGDPHMSKDSTSHAERRNLTMRMQVRRLTRLTHAFSKKWDEPYAALALYFAWYGFVRVHQTLRDPCDGSKYHKSRLDNRRNV
jgi:hypothetical protein